MKKFYLDEREVIALYKQTGSTSKVAAHYGCQSETIRRILIANDIPRRKCKPPKKAKRNNSFILTKENEAKIVALYSQLGNYSEVAKQVGCSTTTIGRVLERNGLNPGYGGSKIKITDEQLVEECKVLTRKQIAEKYGMHIAGLDRRMHKLGIHAVYETKYDAKPIRSDDARQTFVNEKSDGKFSFVSYLGRKHYLIKCNCCGNKFDVCSDKFSDGQVVCGACGESTVRVTRARNYRKWKKSNLDWHWTDSGNELVKKHQPDYEFISYKDGRYRLKCKKCGCIIERARATVVYKNLRCEYCAEEKAKQDERQRLINVLQNAIESKTPKNCESCGSVFYSPYATQKYCSDRCKRKRSNSSKGYRGRARKYKVPYVPGITLKAVANRDKGICQLCGKPVDWSDNTWGDSFGAMYPTIDHIVAMANGGGHTWDNVQLAHAICNSYKRDLSENEEISTAVLEGVKLMGKEAQYAEIQTA